MNKSALGQQGETCAVEFLTRNGYRILNRNLRTKFGEIDVVASDGNVLCFVEVKTRSTCTFGLPEEWILPEKQRRLGRLAQWYLQYYRVRDVPVRFDVVSILLGSNSVPTRTRLIKGAFALEE